MIIIETDIKQKYKDEISRVREEYRNALLKHLTETRLYGVVIRIRDGKEGKLCVEYVVDSPMGYEIRFYPYTAKGELSQRQSGWVNTFTDLTDSFKPKEA